MKYRERMHLSQKEFDETDLWFIYRDFEMMKIEAEVDEMEQEKNSQKAL